MRRRGRKGKMEDRSSKEYNLITSHESGGQGGAREQPRVSRSDVNVYCGSADFYPSHCLRGHVGLKED